MNTLSWLQDWYIRHCDGVWEHSWGISVDTLDNPGWTITVDLRETELFDKNFEKAVVKRSETDWMMCFVQEAKFEARCGPGNLEEALVAFRTFATTGE
jgi:hypothetical protein